MITQAQIDRLVQTIIDQYRPKKIILFGSYAYGIPVEDSDLDILIIKENDLPRFKRAREVRKLIRGMINITKDILVYTPAEVEEWKDVEQAFITEILKKGKTIYEDKKRFDS